jgi:hypothetical protein
LTTTAGVVSESVRDEERDALRRALLRTVAYADIFDYPLDRDQIHRYLIGHEASRASIEEMIDRDDTLRGRVQCTDGLFHLRGRGGIVATRRRRAETSARLWTIARRWVMAIAWLPLVRSVAITGALAMDNAEPDSDIDLFILTQPGRLWLCRLLVLVLVRVARLRGVRLCPNFLLSTDRLVLGERNLFTAHEIAQTISVTSSAWSDEFREANRWTAAFLPNARDARAAPLLSSQPLAARLASRVLAAPAFDRVERWEMQRKIKRLLARAGRDGGSVAFSKDECRGHFAAHDVRVLAEFSTRVARLEASP